MKLYTFSLWAAVVTSMIPLFGNAAGADVPLISSSMATITKLDFDASMQRVPEDDRVEYMLDQKRIDTTVQSLYVNRVLANEARKMELDKDPLVAGQLALQADVLLTKAWVAKFKKDAKLPDFEPRAHEKYRIEDKQFTVEPQVHAMHILIDTKARSRDEALKRAKEIRAKVVAGQKDFSALAQEFSDDSSAKMNKGNLGFFDAGKMVKPFSEAAFAMTEPGQISEPIETPFGFHIIKLIEKKKGYKKPYDSVKADIIKELQQEHYEGLIRDYVEGIKTDKTIKTNTEAILGLKPVILNPEVKVPQAKKP